MPENADLAPGTMVGEYRIDGVLGSGPTGRVHSAIHAVISKRVAIKVLHPQVASSSEAIERCFAAARAANALGHPNIVDVVAFGKLADGRSYLIMEHLRGESLRERTKRTRMPIAEALAILGTITLPLGDAHEKGIVHRDLKPENVFLVEVKGERPLVKLIDFGTADLLGSSMDARKGTALAYVAPEQARGEAATAGTDVYALGVMAFELVTGKTVFEAKTTADMLDKIQNDKPRSASELNSEVPAQLDALIKSLLAKTPADRPSLEKIRSELRACRLLVGGALTPPAGVPIVPPADVAAAKAEASAADAKADAKKDTKKDAKAEAKKDDAKKDAKKETKKEAATATATEAPKRPTAPSTQSKAGAVVAVILLVAAAIGIGGWIVMNQRDEPQHVAPPANVPAVAPDQGSGSAAATDTDDTPTPTEQGSAIAPADQNGASGPAMNGSGSAATGGAWATGSGSAAATAGSASSGSATPAGSGTPAVPQAPSAGSGSGSAHHHSHHHSDATSPNPATTPGTPPAPAAAPTPAPAGGGSAS